VDLVVRMARVGADFASGRIEGRAQYFDELRTVLGPDLIPPMLCTMRASVSA